MKTIPPTPDIKDIPLVTGGQMKKGDMTFKNWLVTAINGFAKAGQGSANIRLQKKIVDKIEASNGEIELEDAQFDFLKEAIEESRWLPEAARELVPFFDVIREIDRQE